MKRPGGYNHLQSSYDGKSNMKPRINRRIFLSGTLGSAVLLSHSSRVIANESAPDSSGVLPDVTIKPDVVLVPPSSPEQWPAFRKALQLWRQSARQQIQYSDAFYRREDFQWASKCFCCGFLMMCDEQFYDPREGQYRVDETIDEAIREFGGYDAVVLWHAYPRIGLDDRNQFDFYRDMPGGIKGLRQAVDRFHHRQVRVFIDYNPWDTGTRREGKDDLAVLAEMVAATDADGIFLDTMDRGAPEFRAALDAVRPGVVLEGEGALPLERIGDHHLSWAQWFPDGEVPGILRNKWFERRHIQHQIKRWDIDHSGELHAAWMNGSGMMVWENVFGSWVEWNPRDKSILRSMLPIQRRYASIFCGEQWTPLVPTLANGVFASRWEGDGIRLWTLVNRLDQGRREPVLEIKIGPDEQIFDLYQGMEVLRWRNPEGRGTVATTFRERDIGCLIAGTREALGGDFDAFLNSQNQLYAKWNGNTKPPPRITQRLVVPSLQPISTVPPGMIEIPAAEVELRIDVRVRECGFYESAPLPGHRLASSYEFQLHSFQRKINLLRFAMDITPVTNAEYQRFLRESAYRPRHPENFLKHWKDGIIPPGKEKHPVVYVDLDDARAYARWAGKRLPTEEQWQYAAQGADGRAYPWGNEMRSEFCNGGQTGDTAPVDAFPQGRSPFGILDLCGNVWEWSESERSDGRTRFCMIRGGSYYQAKGSNWYMDGGPRPVNFAEKFLLMWPGLDRCATVGFRCTADLA
jgi:formylglycine-generating enzyme required for sulfatase activity